MPRRRRSNYGSYYSGYSREKQRKVPSPLPYLVVALLASAGLAYFHFVAFKSLSGTVTNSYTGAAMAGITVTITSGVARPITGTVEGTTVMTTATTPDGAFHFDKI